MSESGRPAALHHLLLRADSRLPDELLVEARFWLAGGMLVDVAQAVVFTALTSRIPLREVDIELLAQTLGEAGGDIDMLADIEVATDEVMPLYGLAPVGPEVLAQHGERIPYNLDLTGSAEGPTGPDQVDAAFVGAIGDMAGPRAVWRCWRYPALNTQWPPPKRMYLVQVGPADGDTLPGLAARLQTTLLDAGEPDPLVTVFADADTLPVFQRTALGFAALLWTAEPQPEIRVARLTVTRDADGSAAAPPLDPAERDRTLRYLELGVPLVITTAFLQDAMDPGRGATVPTNFRTDGTWVWSDAIAYYLEQHGVPLADEFAAHIRERQYAVAEVDVVSLQRSLAVVQAPVAEASGQPVAVATG